MLIFCVLICVISLALQLPVSLYIHNWCQDIYLTSPVYFMRGGRWCAVPGRRIHIDAVMQNRLGFDIEQGLIEGALAYKLREKCAASDQDELNNIWFIVAWHGEHTKGLHIHALLVKHDKKLDEYKLRKLCQKRWPLLKAQANVIRGNWPLDDATVLETTIKVMHESHRWDIFISGRISYNVKREILFNKR
jgi:hypothetical protein